MLLENLLNSFKRYALHEKGLSPNTIKEIVSAVSRLNNFSKVDSIKGLSSGVIRDYLYTQREERCWSPRTFRNQRQYIKLFFNYCVSDGYLQQNPVDKIARPKLPETLPRFLTSKQIGAILTSIELCNWRYSLERYRNKTIIYMLLFTGMRLNELVNLQVTDINMIDKEIIIRKGKGQKQRIIPIHYSLFPILQHYIDYRKQQKATSIWFFYNLKGIHQMRGRSVQMLCKKLSKKTGIYFSPHWFRHSFARLCINSEIGLYKVKEMMGHSNISTTETYLSVSKQSLKNSFCNTELIT